jgi:hypothetical protein
LSDKQGDPFKELACFFIFSGVAAIFLAYPKKIISPAFIDEESCFQISGKIISGDIEALNMLFAKHLFEDAAVR